MVWPVHRKKIFKIFDAIKYLTQKWFHFSILIWWSQHTYFVGCLMHELNHIERCKINITIENFSQYSQQQTSRRWGKCFVWGAAKKNNQMQTSWPLMKSKPSGILYTFCDFSPNSQLKKKLFMKNEQLA